MTHVNKFTTKFYKL